MGNQNQVESYSFENQFDVEADSSGNGLYHLQTKDNKQFYTGRHLKSQNVDDTDEIECIIQEKMKNPSPFLIKLLRQKSFLEPSFCSNVDHFYLLFHKPQHTLNDQMAVRSSTGLAFHPNQIITVIRNISKALLYLDTINHFHTKISSRAVSWPNRENMIVQLIDEWALPDHSDFKKQKLYKPKHQEDREEKNQYLCQDFYDLGMIAQQMQKIGNYQEQNAHIGLPNSFETVNRMIAILKQNDPIKRLNVVDLKTSSARTSQVVATSQTTPNYSVALQKNPHKSIVTKKQTNTYYHHPQNPSPSPPQNLVKNINSNIISHPQTNYQSDNFHNAQYHLQNSLPPSNSNSYNTIHHAKFNQIAANNNNKSVNSQFTQNHQTLIQVPPIKFNAIQTNSNYEPSKISDTKLINHTNQNQTTFQTKIQTSLNTFQHEDSKIISNGNHITKKDQPHYSVELLKDYKPFYCPSPTNDSTPPTHDFFKFNFDHLDFNKKQNTASGQTYSQIFQKLGLNKSITNDVKIENKQVKQEIGTIEKQIKENIEEQKEKIQEKKDIIVEESKKQKKQKTFQLSIDTLGKELRPSQRIDANLQFSTIVEGSQREDSFKSEDDYVIEEYQNGSKYEGHKKNNLRNGYGKFYYQQGSLYDGEWKNNNMHGKGKLYYSNGKLAYEGEWFMDQFHGKGKVYNDQPTPISGTYNYRNFEDLQEKWKYYEGNLVADSKQGHGKLVLSNGECFEGEFVNDKVEGKGQFHTLSGDIIKGEWKNNSLQE